MKFPKVALILVSAFFFVAPQARAQDEEKANRILREVANRYEKLGDFSVSSLDLREEQSSITNRVWKKRTQNVGRFGGKTRAALIVDDLGKPKKRLLTKLRDQNNFYEARDDSPAEISSFVSLQSAGKEAANQRFFADSSGLLIVSLILQRYRSNSLFVGGFDFTGCIVDSRGGNTTIVAMSEAVSNTLFQGWKQSPKLLEIVIGKDGYIKTILTISEDEKSRVELASQLSTPIPFQNPALFVWKNLAPKISPNSR